MQYSHPPQASWSQATPTGSPSFSLVTPGPRAEIKPTPSWPGIKGSCGLPVQSPLAAWRSVWQTPFATTLIRTSPCPGVGIGTSSTVSGLLNKCTTAAFIVLAITTSWNDVHAEEKTLSGGRID